MMIITNLGDTTRVDWTQKAVLARTFIINYIIILFFAPPTGGASIASVYVSFIYTHKSTMQCERRM